MPNKIKEVRPIETNKTDVPILFANMYGVFEVKNEVIIDFGFSGLSYYGKHKEEEYHLARIALSQDDFLEFCDFIGKRVKEIKKDKKASSTKVVENKEA
jgi:hypothetical protein